MSSIRSYTDDDLPALLDFALCQLETEDDSVVSSWRSIFTDTLRLPGREPRRDCILLFDGSTLRGFCLLSPETSGRRCVLNIGVSDPVGARDEYRALVRAGVRQAGEAGAVLAHIVLGPPHTRAAALEAEGFAVARMYWDMTWGGGALLDVVLPDKYHIRLFSENDISPLTAAHNAAFAGSWQFSPDSDAMVAHRARMANTSNDGIRLLFYDDELAGYCWTLLVSDGQHKHGVIGSIGLTPEFRGRGVAKALLLSGMEFLVSAGADRIRLEVDDENTPAIRLYQSIGFAKTGELHWYEKQTATDPPAARGSGAGFRRRQ
jgi:mycothiol synthase